ncbi:MAG: nicotinate-nucleotide--dimethylbenzimidazole phosphoribosyltransferase, partial [Mycobacteriaceae bacterium]
ARAEGLGVGWVTLFDPDSLAALLQLPDGVVTLGWLCLGWPDERPPAPGLERAGWSQRLPLEQVVVRNRWPTADLASPPSHLRGPAPAEVVAARDDADTLLTPLGSLGVLDRAVDRAVALGVGAGTPGMLVLAVGRHPVASLGVSAFAPSVTDDVLSASRAGRSLGAVAAAAAGLELLTVDTGSAVGDLETTDPLDPDAVDRLMAEGEALGSRGGLVALGEVGVGNTTVAAALAAATLDLAPERVVGLGAGSDAAIVERKVAVVRAALARWRSGGEESPQGRLCALGGPELALLTGVVLGACRSGGLVVLDGLATSVAALLAVELAPGAAAHLVAGQRSREQAHPLVLDALGLEPLLDLRIRAGEGVGAALAAQLLRTGLRVRAEGARTHPTGP